ncbi:MAG: TldD/PmbA family protein [Thermoplasmata archaeon]|nr:TldD/PmbA family protein [Candidatus Sysuiplasma acidicola]
MSLNADNLADISERIVSEAVRAGADDAIVSGINSDTRQIRFSENRIDIFNNWNDTSFHLFLARQKRVVATTIKGNDDYREAVRRAIETAGNSEPSSDYFGIAKSTKARNYASSESPVSDATLSGFAHDAINAAVRDGSSSCSGSLYGSFYTRCVASSSGINRKERAGSYYLSIRCFAGEEASGHSVISSLRSRGFHPERAAEKAAMIASSAGKPGSCEEGKYDTILDPMVVATLTSHVGMMASAYQVVSGFSCLGGKIGRHIASESVTIEDDAERKLYGFRRFDDEGVETRKTKIISRGVLKSYLHNTSTSKKFGVRNTANAGLIEPEAFMLSFDGGDRTREEMIRELKDGLYINNVWYTRYKSYARGDFSTIPRDAILRVKNGEIVGSVKGIRITENLIGLMKRVSAASREREHLSWWGESFTPSTVPYITVKKLNVTRSSDL